MTRLQQLSTVMTAMSLAALLLPAAPAWAKMSSTASISSADRTFMMKASEANVGEIDAGKLAEKRAVTKSARLLGKRFVDNHTVNEQKLEILAQKVGLALPMHPTANARAQAQALASRPGLAFDKAFVRDEEADHAKVIAAFQHEISGGSDPAVIAYAKASLPVLEEHLILATDDAGRLRMMPSESH